MQGTVRLLPTMLLLFVLTVAVTASPVDSYREARRLLDEGDQVAAVAGFRSAVAQNPRYLDAWIGLSEAFLQLQEFDEALAAVQRARELAGASLPVRNLHADILLSLGRIEDAERLYREVLQREPNNTDAIIGTAQIALARNNPEAASRVFARALERSPRNRTALLSLALVADAAGNYSAAERYIEQALAHHNNNPAVHYTAARLYLSRGQTEQAGFHIATALSLRDYYPDAMLLQGGLALQTGEPGQALAVMEQLLQNDPENVRAWYISAVAEHEQNRPEVAIRHLERALRLAPGNEYVRVVYETILRQDTDLEDPLRDAAALYHLDLADGYRNQNLLRRAQFHYRRALQLAPFSSRARRGYAAAFEEQQLYARYVEELLLLQDIGIDDQEIRDGIEIYSSMLLDSVGERWGIDQFELSRISVPVQIFMTGDLSDYPGAAGYLPSFIQDVFSANTRLEFAADAATAANEVEAFRIARDSGADYYLVFEPQVFDEGVQFAVGVYVARTGTRIASASVIREGAQSFSRALWVLQERTAGMFPMQAAVVERRFRHAVIDRGAMDGLEPGDELPIYSARSGMPRTDSPGLLFPDGAGLGRFVVEQVDDTIALGRITGGGFFDRVAVGDVVVKQPEDIPDPPRELGVFPPLYRQIRALD
ncbi:tetratricopeptide repeat protein [Spirochaeta africana]|uniref:Tfp pilus assembly protein PilF n=1 Tax=Spirochaeta africana (strain ATCC 700263 / DSM 8902 / Z-7692) TaxID=889378 RepID=H9UJJ9_SPIAZ|nr:tetratricopeptide repeat protein [Spirochaeta africana]AFG37692.1 Tfp pilus assembly protein PilF [Spirochaeta africana DSM 8902]